MLCTFRGVTQLRMTSSLTGKDNGRTVLSTQGPGVAGVTGVAGVKGCGQTASSLLRLAKAAMSIVERSFGRS